MRGQSLSLVSVQSAEDPLFSICLLALAGRRGNPVAQRRFGVFERPEVCLKHELVLPVDALGRHFLFESRDVALKPRQTRGAFVGYTVIAVIRRAGGALDVNVPHAIAHGGVAPRLDVEVACPERIHNLGSILLHETHGVVFGVVTPDVFREQLAQPLVPFLELHDGQVEALLVHAP